MSISLKEELKRIFEGFEFDEARHARFSQDDFAAMDGAEDDLMPDSEFGAQEPTLADMVAKKISTMKNTMADLQTAIDNEKNNMTSSSGLPYGAQKINNWQSRFNDMQFKSSKLQQALDQYTQDPSEENERNLRILSTKLSR